MQYAKTVAAGQQYLEAYGSSVELSYTYNAMNALTAIADGLDQDYSCAVTCDLNGNITQVVELQAGSPPAGLTTAFTYDALNRLTVMQETRKQSGVVGYTKRHHGYDGLGRLTASALTQWSAGGEEPSPDYRDHLYAGARHIGNADSGGTTYGARWHWAGGQQDHSAPLFSPNADTAGQQGYNVARAQSPQQATWTAPTTAGDDKLLYGQGRPMAKDAVGGGTAFAEGLTSTEGAVTVESRLFFDGTVASSSSANDLSRATDAREKVRIGILGSALSYAGSYGRVTSESIGRDLNPLGRGDGSAYVAGGMNLGRISPALPWNSSPGGWGNSVNNGCVDCRNTFLLDEYDPRISDGSINIGPWDIGSHIWEPPTPGPTELPPDIRPKPPTAELPSAPVKPRLSDQDYLGLSDADAAIMQALGPIHQNTQELGMVGYYARGMETHYEQLEIQRKINRRISGCCSKIPIGVACSDQSTGISCGKYFRWPHPRELCAEFVGGPSVCAERGSECTVACIIDLAISLVPVKGAWWIMKQLFKLIKALGEQDWKALLKQWTLEKWIAILKASGAGEGVIEFLQTLSWILSVYGFFECATCCWGLADACSELAKAGECVDPSGRRIRWSHC